MPNVTLPRITATYGSAEALNTALAQIETELNALLSRLGEAPNQMTAPLDMNSQRVLNLPPAGSDNEPVTLKQWRDGSTLNLFAPGPHTHLWADITDKPTQFTPVSHGHQIVDIIGLQSTLTSIQNNLAVLNENPRTYVQPSDPVLTVTPLSGDLWIY
jgi:hypothetical protein